MKYKKILSILLLKQVSSLNKQIYCNSKSSKFSLTVKSQILPDLEKKTICTLNNKIKFEIRANEDHHNVAHFHVTKHGEGSGSYRIDDLSTIKSDLSSKTEKIILEWANKNHSILKEIWNEFHGNRITVS